MLGRVHRLFQRYPARHLTLTARARSFTMPPARWSARSTNWRCAMTVLSLTGQAEADL